MNKNFLRLFLFIVFLVFLSTIFFRGQQMVDLLPKGEDYNSASQGAGATPVLTKDEATLKYEKALELLQSTPQISGWLKIISDAGNKPIFINDGVEGDFVDVQLREGFPDDPHTTRVGTWRVNYKTKEIQIYDVVNDQYRPLKENKPSNL